MRMNCTQVRYARKMMGQRNAESKKQHNRVVPKTRQCCGKGNVWATKWHDVNVPMTSRCLPSHEVTASWADLDMLSEAELASM